jgi:hypothetical protein
VSELQQPIIGERATYTCKHINPLKVSYICISLSGSDSSNEHVQLYILCGRQWLHNSKAFYITIQCSNTYYSEKGRKDLTFREAAYRLQLNPFQNISTNNPRVFKFKFKKFKNNSDFWNTNLLSSNVRWSPIFPVIK